MTAEDLIKSFRSLADDEDLGHESDMLWKDEEVLRYINRAQREACLRAKLIKDNTTTAVTQISVVAGTSIYDLHASIIRIDDIYLSSTGKSLSKVDRSEVKRLDPRWRSASGTVTVWMEHWGIKKIEIYKIPTATDTLYLDVVRLPITPVTALSTTLEIQDEFLDQLVDGVAWYAFLKKDSQTLNLEASKRHHDLFSLSFGPPVKARSELVFREQYGTTSGSIIKSHI